MRVRLASGQTPILETRAMGESTYASPATGTRKAVLTRLKSGEPDSSHAVGKKPSRVNVPHECHRFLVTNRTPHRGQMLMPGTASSISTGPSSVPLQEIHDLARRKASLHRPQAAVEG
jgi:hypothetical protein